MNIISWLNERAGEEIGEPTEEALVGFRARYSVVFERVGDVVEVDQEQTEGRLFRWKTTI